MIKKHTPHRIKFCPSCPSIPTTSIDAMPKFHFKAPKINDSINKVITLMPKKKKSQSALF